MHASSLQRNISEQEGKHMLVLTRKIGDAIEIDGQISVIVKKISGNRVVLGIDAPQHFHIKRGELPPRDRSEQPFATVTAKTLGATTQPSNIPEDLVLEMRISNEVALQTG